MLPYCTICPNSTRVNCTIAWLCSGILFCTFGHVKVVWLSLIIKMQNTSKATTWKLFFCMHCTVQFMHARIYCVSNQWWTLYNLVLLISIPTEQFSLPPQLPPRNFTPSENRDSHAEPVKTIEQSRVSIVDTYLQRVQHVDMSQYYMIYSMLSIPQYLTLLNYLYYKTIYTKMTNNTFNYDWYYGSVKNNEHWLGDHMAIYCVC